MKSAVLAISLLTLAAIPAGGDQSLDVTDGTHNDSRAQAAVNDLNGDIYTVWTRFSDDFSQAAVHGRWAWRQGDGTYTLGGEIQVSPAGAFHAFPKVDFVPWLNAYAIVWQTFDPGSGLLEPGKIMGRLVGASGSPQGGSKTIIRPKNRANIRPHVIATTPWNGAPPPYDENALTVLYSALPTQPGQGKVGVVAQPLRDNLKRKGKSRSLGGVKIVSGSTPYGFDDLDVQPVVDDAVHFQPWVQAGLTTFNLQNGSVFASIVHFGKEAGGKPTVVDRTDLRTTSRGPDFGDLTIAEDPDRQDDFGVNRSSMLVVSAFVNGGFGAEFLDNVFSGDLDGYLLIGSDTDIDGSYLPRNYDHDIPGQNADLPLRRSSAGVVAGSPIGRIIYPESKRMVSREVRVTSTLGLEIDTKRDKLFKVKQSKLLQTETVGSHSHAARAIVWVEELGAQRQQIRLYIE